MAEIDLSSAASNVSLNDTPAVPDVANAASVKMARASLKDHKLDLKAREYSGADLDVSYHRPESTEIETHRDPIETSLLGATPDYAASLATPTETKDVDGKTYETSQQKAFAAAALADMGQKGKDGYMTFYNPATDQREPYDVSGDPVLQRDLLNHEIQKAGEALFSGDDRLNARTLKSKEFQATQTVGSYALLTAAEKAREEARGDAGFTGAFSRSWGLEREQNGIFRKVNSGEIDKKEADRQLAEAEDKYFRFSDEDYETSKLLGQQAETMAEPVTQGYAGKFALGALGLGTLGGPGGLAAASRLSGLAYQEEMFRLEAQANMGRQLMESYWRGDNLTDEEVRQRYWWAATGSAAVDVLGFNVLSKFALKPVSDMLKPVVKKSDLIPDKIKKLIFKDPQAVKKAADDAEGVFKSSMENFAKRWAFNYLAGTTGEAVTEGVQGAIEKAGDLNVQGKDITAGEVAKAGGQSLKDALAPSALLTGVFMTPQTIVGLGRIGFDVNHAASLSQKKAQDEVYKASAAESMAAGASAENVAGNLNEVLGTDANNYYIDPQAAKDKLEKAQLDPAGFGGLFRGLDKAIAEGRDIEIPRSVWNTITEQKGRGFLIDLITDRMGSQDNISTPEERKAERDKLHLEINNDIDRANKRYSGMETVRGEIEGALSQAGHADAKQNNALGSLYSAFFAAMSENTGLDIVDLWHKYRPQIQSFEVEANLNTNERQQREVGAFNPQKNILKFREDADFSTLFHESSHFFVRTMLAINKEHPTDKFNKVIKGINDWLGVKDGELQADTYLRNDALGEKARKFDEALAYAIPSYLLGEKVDRRLRPLASEVVNMLASLDNYTVYPNRDVVKKIRKNGNGRLSMFFNDKFKSRFREDLPVFDNRLGEFVHSLFTSQILVKQNEQIYPMQHDLVDLHSGEFAQEDLDLLHELGEALKAAAAQEIHRSMLDNVKQILGLDDKLIKLLKRYTAKNSTEFAEFLAKHERLKKAFETRKKRYKNRIKNSTTATLLSLIKEQGISRENAKAAGLDDAEIKSLEQQGVVRDGATGLIEDFAPEFQNPTVDREAGNFVYIGKDGKAAYPKAYMKKYGEGKGLLKWIANLPDMDALAGNAALRHINSILTDSEKAETIMGIPAGKGMALGFRIKYGRELGKAVARVLKQDPDKAELRDGILKETARDTVRGMSYGDLSPKRFYLAAARAHKYAEKYWREGQYDQAVRYLNTEQYNNYCAQYAQNFKERFEKDAKKMAGFYNKSDKELSKTRGIGGAKLVQFYLQMMGLTKPKHDINHELQELQNAGGLDIGLYGNVVNDAIADLQSSNGKVHLYTASTVGELADMFDKVRQLDAAARNAKRVVVGGKAIEIDELRRMAKADEWEHKDNNTGHTTVDHQEGLTPNPKDSFWKKMLSPRRWYFEATAQLHELCQRIDGKPDGFMSKHIFEPLQNGSVNYRLEKRETLGRIANAINKLPIVNRKIIYSDVMVRDANGNMVPLALGGGRNKTIIDVLGFMMHYGNPDNYRKMIEGNFGTRDMSFEEKEAYFNKLLDHLKEDKILTTDTMDVIQEVWDIFAEKFAGVQQVDMMERGYITPAVKNRAFTFNGKRYRGGYAPLMVNRDLASVETKEVSLDNISDQFAEQIPAVKSGFDKQRQAKTAPRPISVDFMQMMSGLDDVLKYKNLQGAVKMVQRLATDPVIGGRIDSYAPGTYNDVIRPILISIAQQCTYKSRQSRSMQAAERIISKFNRGFVAAVMSFNFNNTLQQITTLPLATIDISPRYIIKYTTLAALDSLKSILTRTPNYLEESAKSKSALMRSRWGSDFDSPNQVFRRFNINPARYVGFRKGIAVLQNVGETLQEKGAYMMQAGFQHKLDVIVFNGAYEKYINQHGKDKISQEQLEKDAVKYAENMVERYGTPIGIEESSKVDRASPFLKIFMMFTKYFTNLVNVRMAKYGENKRLMASKDFATKMQGYLNQAYCDFMIFAVNPILCEVVNGIFQGYWWNDNTDEDWKRIWQKYLTAPISQITASIPLVGKAGQAGMNKILNDSIWDTNTYMGDKDPLTAAMVQSLERGVSSVYSIIKSKLSDDSNREVKSSDIRNIMNLGSIATGNGMWGALGRPLAFIYNQENKVDSSGQPAERPEGLEIIPAAMQGK